MLKLRFDPGAIVLKTENNPTGLKRQLDQNARGLNRRIRVTQLL